MSLRVVAPHGKHGSRIGAICVRRIVEHVGSRGPAGHTLHHSAEINPPVQLVLDGRSLKQLLQGDGFPFGLTFFHGHKPRSLLVERNCGCGVACMDFRLLLPGGLVKGEADGGKCNAYGKQADQKRRIYRRTRE